MAERKKIALGLECPLLLRGGVSVLVETLIRGLHEHYDFVVVSPDDKATLANHPAAKMIAAHIPWNWRQVTPQSARQLADELAKHRVNLAHFHIGGVFGWGNRYPGHSPINYLRPHNIPACSTVHLVVKLMEGYCGAEKPFWFKLALFPLAWTAKLQTLRHLACEIAVSHHDADKLRRWYWPQKKKFRQIYHSRLRTDSPALVEIPREQTIVNIGHIAVRKGQIDLVEGFAQIAARHPAWKLVLVGELLDKPAVERIRAIAAQNNLTDRIQLLGERQDAFELMRRAGIYVQPSHQEALGLALQEAMFYGCPSIGTRIGGIPELIEHQKTGLLVEAHQPAALAQAMETLITDAALRAQFGRAGAASIAQKGMTEAQMLAAHFQLYESILRGN